MSEEVHTVEEEYIVEERHSPVGEESTGPRKGGIIKKLRKAATDIRHKLHHKEGEEEYEEGDEEGVRTPEERATPPPKAELPPPMPDVSVPSETSRPGPPHPPLPVEGSQSPPMKSLPSVPCPHPVGPGEASRQEGAPVHTPRSRDFDRGEEHVVEGWGTAKEEPRQQKKPAATSVRLNSYFNDTNGEYVVEGMGTSAAKQPGRQQTWQAPIMHPHEKTIEQVFLPSESEFAQPHKRDTPVRKKMEHVQQGPTQTRLGRSKDFERGPPHIVEGVGTNQRLADREERRRIRRKERTAPLLVTEYVVSGVGTNRRTLRKYQEEEHMARERERQLSQGPSHQKRSRIPSAPPLPSAHWRPTGRYFEEEEQFKGQRLQAPSTATRPDLHPAHKGIGNFMDDIKNYVKLRAMQFKLKPTTEVRYGYGQKVYLRDRDESAHQEIEKGGRDSPSQRRGDVGQGKQQERQGFQQRPTYYQTH